MGRPGSTSTNSRRPPSNQTEAMPTSSTSKWTKPMNSRRGAAPPQALLGRQDHPIRHHQGASMITLRLKKGTRAPAFSITAESPITRTTSSLSLQRGNPFCRRLQHRTLHGLHQRSPAPARPPFSDSKIASPGRNLGTTPTPSKNNHRPHNQKWRRQHIRRPRGQPRPKTSQHKGPPPKPPKPLHPRQRWHRF